MEREREENSAGDAECRRDDDNASSMKIEGHNVLDLPVAPESYRSSGCPPVYVDSHEIDWLNRRVASFPESAPRASDSFHGSNTKQIVQELSGRPFSIPNVAMSNSFGNIGRVHHKGGHWQHLYQLAGGSTGNIQHGGPSSMENDHMTLGVRGDLKRTPCDIRGVQHSSGKRIKQTSEEISACLSSGYNKMIPSNTLRLSNNGSNGSPSSCFFPQLSVKNTVKGKEVASSIHEVHTVSNVTGMCLKEETPPFVNQVSSAALLSPSVTSNNHQDSTHDGICLRDRLKPGCCRLKKAESLQLFRRIVELVDFAHCRGVSLQDLRPSCFILLPSNKIKYTGPFPQIDIHDVVNHSTKMKRPAEVDDGNQSQHTSKHDFRSNSIDEQMIASSGVRNWSATQNRVHNNIIFPNSSISAHQQSSSVNAQLEKKWYAAPENNNGSSSTFAANIYKLGVLLFELLCSFESWEKHSAVMLDMQQRIFPPAILSEYPIEAGFCLWLLHPVPSSRPTTREVLQSGLLNGSKTVMPEEDLSASTEEEIADLEMVQYFLSLVKEKKERHATKLLEDLGCLEADLKDAYTINSSRTSCYSSEKMDRTKSGSFCKSIAVSTLNEAIFSKSMSQLEDAYFSMRSQAQPKDAKAEARSDKDLLKNRGRLSLLENKNAGPSMSQGPSARIGPFFESICKFACRSKLEVCGTLRNGDLLNSSNVTCSLSVDRDDEYIAAAGVSKKIKVFDCNALLDDTLDVHYPVVEMASKSKFSCVCWNSYIRNYLASTNYDGVVQMWDANTGQDICQYSEHQKRAWSVDFSPVDPTKFASGSDDCLVKLWNVNERNSTGTIRNPANICCVQFSSYSSNLLVFGSADYKTYCYDLRHTRIPWCTLAGHGKTVSYVRFIDSDTLVSASTDNTLKLWDLNKTSSSGLSDGACSLTFKGHANEKNFVGLSALDGYIACGSESNEVFTYWKSLPMPITSYKFAAIDPISGHEIIDDNTQFVSSVCWRRKSNMIVAANSTGSIKLLRMV